MSYGKVKDTFWSDRKIRGFSDDAKMLALYFMTGPHRNMLGCMRVPDGYIMADTGWSSERLADAIRMLCDKAFICRDSDGWTLILNQLKHDPFKVPNHAKAAIALVAEVPRDSVVYQELVPRLKAALNAMPTPCEWHPDDIAIPLPSPLPEPSPEPLPEKVGADAPELDTALHAYNRVAERTGLPVAQRLTDARRKSLRARLAECGGQDGWLMAMAKLENSPFLLGQNDKRWKADLGFILRAEKFTKLMEGGYDQSRTRREMTMEALSRMAGESEDEAA